MPAQVLLFSQLQTTMLAQTVFPAVAAVEVAMAVEPLETTTLLVAELAPATLRDAPVLAALVAGVVAAPAIAVEAAEVVAALAVVAVVASAIAAVVVGVVAALEVVVGAAALAAGAADA